MTTQKAANTKSASRSYTYTGAELERLAVSKFLGYLTASARANRFGWANIGSPDLQRTPSESGQT